MPFQHSATMIRQLLTIGLVLMLAAGVPVLSFLTARRPELRQIPRTDLYFSAVVSQWLLTAVAVAVIWVAGPGFRIIGFQPLAASDLLFWASTLPGIAMATMGLEIVLERFGLWPEESNLVYLLLPETRLEKLMAACVVAPTAALCEELLYRGFLFTVLSSWLGSTRWALLVASVAFGLAHVYQGARGMVRTALMGALLTIPVMRLGTLYPSMAAHFVIDAVALVWLGPRFLRGNRTPQS